MLCRLLGNAYLVMLKVGMTHTHVNENEEQPRGFIERIFEEYNSRQTMKKFKHKSI